MVPRILITDDTIFMRTRLRTILAAYGYDDLMEAASGTEAVEAYRTYQPHLVLMDVTMPDMDGITAVRQIKKQNAEAKIIMCTALGQRNLVFEALRAGAVDFLVKPFQSDRVIQSVKKFAA